MTVTVNYPLTQIVSKLLCEIQSKPDGFDIQTSVMSPGVFLQHGDISVQDKGDL